jgi:predicted O-linked N-acetylglucosamine transferase (SPINDLY family)
MLLENLSLASLSINDKKALVAELRDAIKVDRSVARSAKLLARADKRQERENKKLARIAKLEEKLAALKNPVGYKAIKSNKKPSKAVITKVAA